MSHPNSAGIFQTVTQQTVEADVRTPNHSGDNRDMKPKHKSQHKDEGRTDIGVSGIVDASADGWSCEISKEGEVGGKKEDGEDFPAHAIMRVGQKRDEHDAETFESKKGSDPACRCAVHIVLLHTKERNQIITR